MLKYKKNLIILLVILVVCAAAYCVYVIADITAENKAAEKKESEIVYIGSLSGEVTSLTVFNGQSENTFDYDFAIDKWRWAYDSELIMRDTYLNNIEKHLLSLPSTRAFEVSDDLSAYGFADPSCYVTALDSNGGSLRLIIGNSIEEDDGETVSYYATEEGGNMVYTIDSPLVDYLMVDFWDMVPIDYIQAIMASESRVVEIITDDSSVVYRQNALSVQSDDENTIYERYVSLNGGEPVPVSDLNGTGEKTAYELYDDLLDTMTGIVYSSCVDWKPNEEALAAYGLADPALTLKVTYQLTDSDSEDSITLKFGAADGSGNMYGILEGSSKVCVLRSSYFDDIQSASNAIVSLM